MSALEGISTRVLIAGCLMFSACDRADHFGRPPSFSEGQDEVTQMAMYAVPLPESAIPDGPTAESSLWSSGRTSLLGDRRAGQTGDIVTVVIEIDDSAEISNSTGRSRSGSENLDISALFGIPQRAATVLPEGASLSPAVATSSSSAYAGDGNVSRNEKLTLRIAASVVEALPSGVLRIEGKQQVLVNFEMRELTVRGFVRPEDITRTNEITYDKIAGAQIAYGGRGQITDVQQPRYGQQLTDTLLPY